MTHGATGSPTLRSYPGVTEPMAPALMRASYDWAIGRIMEHLHAAGFPDVSARHAPVVAFPGPHNTRPSELAARTGRSKQHINILLRQLEAAGYLERRPDGDDQRAKIIHLTDRGMDLAATIKTAVESVEDEWRQLIGDGRLAALKQTLLDLQTPIPGSPRRRPREH